MKNVCVIFECLKMVFCFQNCFSDREKLLKIEAEGREFANFLRSLEQFIQTVKGLNNVFDFGAFSYLINQNNQNSNWKKILGIRNMQEKLENDR